MQVRTFFLRCLGANASRGLVALQGAQTTCFYLAWMIGSFGILASAGATALVARLVGAGDWRRSKIADRIAKAIKTVRTTGNLCVLMMAFVTN